MDQIVSNWIASTLHGHGGTVDESLHRIKDAASREIRFRDRHQIFAFGAVAKGQIWAGVIVNHEPRVDWRDYPPRNNFELSAQQVHDEPFVIVCGETRAISEADGKLLETVARRRPRRSKNFLEFLAGINRRASGNKPYGNVISAECNVSFMPPRVDGGFSRFFDWGKDAPWHMVAIPSIFCGIDFTGMMLEGIRLLEDEVRKNKAAGLI